MEDKQENNYVWRINKNKITEGSKTKFVFDSCCFCIPLRTGCLILGYIQLVVLIVSTCFYIYCAIMRFVVTIAVVALIHALFYKLQPREQHTQGHSDVLGTNIIEDYVVIFVLMLTIIFTILLLVGLHEERRNYIKSYLVYTVITAVTGVIHLTVTISLGSMGTLSGAEVAQPVILVCTLLNICSLLVLRSQYIKMGQSANNLPLQHREDQLMQNADPTALPLYCPQEATDAHTLNITIQPSCQPSCPPKYEDCV